MKASVAVSCLAVFFSASAVGDGLAPGDYILVFGRLADCEQREQLVSWAYVSEQGQARFTSDIEVGAVGMSERQLLAALMTSIAERTGNKPRSLSVRIVTIDDARLELQLLRQLLTSRASCDREPAFPSPEEFPPGHDPEPLPPPPPPGEFPPFREDDSTRIVSDDEWQPGCDAV